MIDRIRGSDTPEVKICTEGGCCPNPGRGGWGAVIIHPDATPVELCGEAETTNNRCEMPAIRTLQSLPPWSEVTLYTDDSQYLRDGIARWMKAWRGRGWKTADKKDVKNRDLWQVRVPPHLLAEPTDRGGRDGTGHSRSLTLSNSAWAATARSGCRARTRR